MTTSDMQDYAELPDAIKELVERVWISRVADAQLDAYWEGFEDGRDQGVRQERSRVADSLCERCGSDVSVCFGCMTRVMTGAIPGYTPDSTK